MKNKRRWHACSLWFMWRKSVMSGSKEGEEYHMRCSGWDSQFCWGCIRHEFATAGLHNNDDDFVWSFKLLFSSWQIEVHSPSKSVLYVVSRHTMKNCRFLEPPGELRCGQEATVIIGPFIERIKVRMTETDSRHAHHYDIHPQTCLCNFMFTNEHPVYIGVIPQIACTWAKIMHISVKNLEVPRSWRSATHLFVGFLVDRRTDCPKGALKTANFCGLTCFTSTTEPVSNVMSSSWRKSASAGLTSIKTKKNA